MPGRDGTGLTGQGPGTGRGFGRDQGRGGMSDPYAAGPGGICICPRCGHQVAHTHGRPCIQRSCPKCGAPMTRQ